MTTKKYKNFYDKENLNRYNTLHYIEAGNPDCLNPTVVFCHGWPDDELLWSSQMKPGGLADTHYCCAVRLPNSGDSGDSGNSGDSGHFGNSNQETSVSFHDIVESIYRTIKLIQQRRGMRRQEKIILVGHDWGAYLGYLLERNHPECIDRLVTIDVGYDFSFNAKDLLVTLLYQGYLAFSFLIGFLFPSIATMLVRIFAAACQSGEGTPTPLNRIHWRSAQYYAYFHVAWWFRSTSKKNDDHSPILENYEPTCPILYLYPTGNRGLTPTFHSQLMLERIRERNDGSKAVEIRKAGHWVVYHQARRCTTIIRHWISE